MLYSNHHRSPGSFLCRSCIQASLIHDSYIACRERRWVGELDFLPTDEPNQVDFNQESRARLLVYAEWAFPMCHARYGERWGFQCGSYSPRAQAEEFRGSQGDSAAPPPVVVRWGQGVVLAVSHWVVYLMSHHPVPTLSLGLPHWKLEQRLARNLFNFKRLIVYVGHTLLYSPGSWGRPVTFCQSSVAVLAHTWHSINTPVHSCRACLRVAWDLSWRTDANQ